jgi:membrane associated rhomboid family serine protease
MGITILVSLAGFYNESVSRGFMMNPYVIHHHRQFYRFLTSGFIHKDFTHLFVNMFSFYFFGRTVEQAFHYFFGTLGNLYFILLYLIAIIVSDIPTYFKEKNNPLYNSLGASGGIAAIIFAAIVFQPLESICIYFICMPGFILGTLYLAYSYYQGKKSRDAINHDAHLYGALFGLVVCIIVYPASLVNFFQQIRSWLMS